MEHLLFNIASLTHWQETHEVIIKISAETRADGVRVPNPYNLIFQMIIMKDI